jgi:hypothetical protein
VLSLRRLRYGFFLNTDPVRVYLVFPDTNQITISLSIWPVLMLDSAILRQSIPDSTLNRRVLEAVLVKVLLHRDLAVCHC